MAENLVDVQSYYEHTKDAYIRWGGGRYIHFGLDLNELGHQASLERLVDEIAVIAQIENDQVVLDSGCGFGGVAMKFAKDKGCYVVGTNISMSQIDHANNLIRNEGLDKKVFILEQDYSVMDRIEDNIFDSAIMCESFYHAPDKGRVIAAHSRVLKSGGTFVIADYFIRRELLESEQELVSLFDSGWKGKTLELFELKNLLVCEGFKGVESKDVTERILPSINIAAISASEHSGDTQSTNGRSRHREATIALNSLVKSGAVGYYFIKATNA